MKEKNIQIEENHQICSHCGRIITDEDFSLVQGEIVCTDCVENYCTTCERCGALIYDDDVYGDDNHCLCEHCYENHYTRCDNCDCVMHVNGGWVMELLEMGYSYDEIESVLNEPEMVRHSHMR